MAGKKELIIASVIKMLEQKEYRDITVLDLVADSGVNRNTFYYHFKDMDALVLELAKRGIDRSFTSAKGNAGNKLRNLADMICKNKTSIMHVYSSAERKDFDQGLDTVCEHLAAKLCASCSELQTNTETEKASWCLLVKSLCYGLFCDWLKNGLDDEGRENCLSCLESLKSIKL